MSGLNNMRTSKFLQRWKKKPLPCVFWCSNKFAGKIICLYYFLIVHFKNVFVNSCDHKMKKNSIRSWKTCIFYIFTWIWEASPVPLSKTHVNYEKAEKSKIWPFDISCKHWCPIQMSCFALSNIISQNIVTFNWSIFIIGKFYMFVNINCGYIIWIGHFFFWCEYCDRCWYWKQTDARILSNWTQNWISS